MQKKGVIFIVLLIGTFIVSNLFVPQTLTINRVVLSNTTAATFLKIVRTDSILKRWCIKNEYVVTGNTLSKNNYSYIISTGGTSIIPIEINGKVTVASILKVIAIDETNCELNWSSQLVATNFFTRIFNYYKAQQLSKELDYFLQHLNTHAQSSIEMYGFDINNKKQTEPIVSFYTQTFANEDKYSGLQHCFSSIKNFVAENNLVSNNTSVMLNLNRLKGDSITIMIGIPTQKSLAKNNFSTMQMPPQGNMLVSEFKGMYKDRSAIYQAMESYIEDKNLSKASLPYEKFSNSVLPSGDSSVVQFTMCYPIF